MKITRFHQTPAKCTPHGNLNRSRGIIRCPDLAGISEEEIVDELSSQNVSEALRISVWRDGVKKSTNTIVLTFRTAILPKTLKIGYLNVGVDIYIPTRFSATHASGLATMKENVDWVSVVNCAAAVAKLQTTMTRTVPGNLSVLTVAKIYPHQKFVTSGKKKKKS